MVAKSVKMCSLDFFCLKEPRTRMVLYHYFVGDTIRISLGIVSFATLFGMFIKKFNKHSTRFDEKKIKWFTFRAVTHVISELSFSVFTPNWWGLRVTKCHTQVAVGLLFNKILSWFLSKSWPKNPILCSFLRDHTPSHGFWRIFFVLKSLSDICPRPFFSFF